MRSWLISIKTLQREMAYTDAEYRDLLFAAAGVRSAKDIGSQEDYEVVMSTLRNGFVPESEPVNYYEEMFPPLAKPAWNIDRDPERIERFGHKWDEYEAAGIIVVMVLDAMGNKYLKWRRK